MKDAIDKMYAEAQRKYYSQFRSKGSKTVLLNDPEKVRMQLIQAAIIANENDLIEAVSQSLQNKKNPDSILEKITIRTEELTKERAVLEAKKQARKAEAQKRAESEPYHMLQCFYSFKFGGQKHKDAMKMYTKKSAAELKELFEKLETFNPTTTSQPSTMKNLIEPCQEWIKSQRIMKLPDAKR
jgi:predicted HicB family RNase H-like nuclease